MTFLRKIVLGIGIAIALTGCTSAPTETGRPINFAKLERVSVGLSTQQNVKEIFGYPQSIEYPDDRTIYRYRYNSASHRQGVDFVFNKKMRLIDVTINDAEEYQPLK